MADARKLAAIVAADVVGYGRLVDADEDRTLARLRALRSDLVDPTIALHNGRVVKRTGDGIIIEFRSVVDAVRCAIEVQASMRERNAGLPFERRIEFRIGIHLGDVVEENDGDLMGEGINIAVRLEEIACPGAVCLSEDAYRLVKTRLDLVVNDLGMIELKNIAARVHVFSLQVGGDRTGPGTKPVEQSVRGVPGLVVLTVAGVAALLLLASAGARYYLGASHAMNVALNVSPAAAHLSIVVLPFANISNDPNQAYFADGITENLTTDLSRIRHSFVIARNTAFSFKDKGIDAREISKELGVRYVLEGSVQRNQSRVGINAQLVDGNSGAAIWAERFEDDLADVFRLQDKVVARLANTLGHELVKAEAQYSLRHVNPDAIDLDMRGWALSSQRVTKTSNMAARGWFEQALKIDPDDADALAGMARTYLDDYSFGWNDPAVDYDKEILGAADRAIAIAPDNMRAYHAKASYLFLSRRAKQALDAAEAGLAVNPNWAALYGSRSGAEMSLGRFEQAITDAQQAMRLSPRDPILGIWHVLWADAELGRGNFDVAIEHYRHAIDTGFRTYV
ncbi:MAG TPA: adenylate/guanylate cyclase domain-containing protein, partial [Bradyrhizobium sp.]